MSSYSCCASDKHKFQKVASLSFLLKLVGDETRLKILCILNKGQHCVCEIERHVNKSQNLISHHLKDLKDAGLVIGEKKGLWVHYSLSEKGKKIINLIFSLE